MTPNPCDSPPPGRYAVLGASGLLGHHMLEALKDKPGVTVRAVFRSRKPLVEASNISFHQADLEDAAAARRALADADRAFLFAGVTASSPVLARDPVGPVTTLVRVCANSLDAAKQCGVKRCVWPGSATAYPADLAQLTEDDIFKGEPPGNWALLGEAYRFLERLCLKLAEGGMSLRVIRPTLVYGENDHFSDDSAHFLPSLMRRVVLRQSPIEVWGDGEQRRDLIHAADVARAALAAMKTDGSYGCYNVACGEPVSVNDFLQALIRLDGFKDAKIAHLLDKPASAKGPRVSADKAWRELGFKPAIGLEQGLARTLSWYRRRMGL